MSETTYTYHGPPSGVTLRVKGGDRELMLFPGTTITAPSGNTWVKAAVARGHLVAHSKTSGAKTGGKSTSSSKGDA